MVTRLKPVDAVTIGAGWTGGIIAQEMTGAGLKVVGLERGGQRNTVPDFEVPLIHDELKYAVRHDFMQDLSRETITFRNNRNQTALPMRQLGSFLPGEGVGGAGVHWNGQHYRFLPWDFETRSRSVARYGEKAVPEDSTVQDWGVTYEELEPFYDRFEYTCGTTGKAGNVQGRKQPGGNPFEGPRKRDYPNPPMKMTHAGSLFKKAAEELGYHPFPQPSSNCSRPYTNPEGAALGACVYCGFCERFGCEMFAKASPQTTVLPVAMKTGNYELRTYCEVVRINVDKASGKATGVTFIDLRSGQEYEQPADLVFLTSYVFNNSRLLLISGIGKPYDPATGQGVVGRNYCYQLTSSVSAFFDDKIFNSFMGAGACGMLIDDFNGDNFDHTGLGFIGGGYLLTATTGARPIQSHGAPPGTPKWGSEWKKAVGRYYNRSLSIGTHANVLAYRSNCLDLDPTYRDVYGLPLLRMTFDWGADEIKRSAYLTDIAMKIAKAMKPAATSGGPRKGHYSIVPYQTTHNTGGVTMGADPKTSAVNRYLQSWDVSNLFVIGASAFPQNAGYNPTGTVGALAYWASDAVRNRYLKKPGPLL